MTPSELLTKAADLIRDTAAKAKPGPWSLYDRGVCWEIPELPEEHDGLSGFREVDARWIALMSPAVAESMSKLLRESRPMWLLYESRPLSRREIEAKVGSAPVAALALAEDITGERAVVGVEEEQHGD